MRHSRLKSRRLQCPCTPNVHKCGKTKGNFRFHQTVSRQVSAKESTTHEAGTGDKGVKYQYVSEGHYKATIEDVLPGVTKSRLIPDCAPWAMGWQTNERNIMWSDDLKLRLIKKVAAQKSSISEEQLEEELGSLVILLPGIEDRFRFIKPDVLVRLISDKYLIAQRLLALKQIFPTADCAKMLASELSLMAEPVEKVHKRAQDLRDFLPKVNIDRLVQDNPCVLSVERFKEAVRDARRLLPGLDVSHMMAKDPNFVLSLQKGVDMIPYDAIPGTGQPKD